MVIAVGETRNARAFDYRCLHECAGGRVVRSDARVSMEERERRGRKEIERRPPTYRRVHAVDEYTTVLRSLGFISALKMPSLSRSRPFPSPRSEHRCSFAKPTRGPPLRLWLNGLPICQDPTPIPCVFSLVPPLLFRSRHPFLPVPCFARSLSLHFTGPSSLSLFCPFERLSLAPSPRHILSHLEPFTAEDVVDPSNGRAWSDPFARSPPNSRIDPPVSGVEGWRTVRSVDHGAIVRYPLSLRTERRGWDGSFDRASIAMRAENSEFRSREEKGGKNLFVWNREERREERGSRGRKNMRCSET